MPMAGIGTSSSQRPTSGFFLTRAFMELPAGNEPTTRSTFAAAGQIIATRRNAGKEISIVGEDEQVIQNPHRRRRCAIRILN